VFAPEMMAAVLHESKTPSHIRGTPGMRQEREFSLELYFFNSFLNTDQDVNYPRVYSTQ
jgi:hypothetical protein